MNSPVYVPLKLKVVAYWFIFEGLSSIIKMAVAMHELRLLLDVGVCQLFVGIGLLKLKHSSHRWAMFWTKLYLVVLPIVAILIGVFIKSPTLDYKVFGIAVGTVSTRLVIVSAVLLACFISWQYSVLDNKEIRQLFSRVNESRRS